ncbi:SirB1 family protein [Gloeobacter morelensis]|uniref:SirB1 family protein n=1 Tax=Gloeobacter morelensis MG652769 TaxID=2781736 RepID=A0ABY3PRX9_9CYAN|nr:SirB1 family protein [Gloeobacter morelensis]UFP96269.1 SirB1 family protein [Gloeobacter morelensis MG652769]
MERSSARQRFIQVLQQPEVQIDLAEAALYIALEAYPGLDVEEYLNALDTMAEEVRERIEGERYPLRMLQGINRYLYDDLGFRGNEEEYYDPRNSFLNEVLDRRTGIPITLALVYLEIARRVDFPMVGVSMPGHFLIRPDRSDMEIHIDAFHRGEILFREDCAERLERIYGRRLELHPAFFEAVGARRFLARMLTNLKFAYWMRSDWQAALGAVERLLAVFPNTPAEWRDRGILHYRLGHPAAARLDLENYLKSAPEAEDAARIRELLAELQKQER